MRITTLCVGLLVLAFLQNEPNSRAQDPRSTPVEPGEITKHTELVGKPISVDDRGGFQYHNETKAFDEINLRRAPEVTFRLPQDLWLRQSPPAAAIRVEGVLHHDRDGWWVEVSSYKAHPPDLSRLNQAIAQLAPSDLEARERWARWALRRGEDFAKMAKDREPNRPTGEETLLARARQILGENVHYLADHAPGKSGPEYWLKLAEQARADRVPEPEPSAQVHRALRAELANATTSESVQAVIRKVEELLPRAAERPASQFDTAEWEKAYANAPADAYRAAPADARPTFDHRLWADATERRIRLKIAENPQSTLAMAEEASRLLPDRPQLSAGLLDKGLNDAATEVGRLRQSEMEALAKTYEEKLGQPERARGLKRAWLDDRREHRLSPRDAEGRMVLADQYVSLLGDRGTAASLLIEAYKIDPSLPEAADALRRLGYRKINEEWLEPSKAKAVASKEMVGKAAAEAGKTSPGEPETMPARRADSDDLRNATPEDVRARFGGKPNKKVLVAGQGQVTEQWIYIVARQVHYVNFQRKGAETRPRVVAHYVLPNIASDTAGRP